MIAENAGKDGTVIVANILKSKDKNYGYNADTDKYEDLRKAGVVDPVKVTRSALQNGASVACLLLTSECVIADIPEPKEGRRRRPRPRPRRRHGWHGWHGHGMGDGRHGRDDVSRIAMVIRHSSLVKTRPAQFRSSQVTNDQQPTPTLHSTRSEFHTRGANPHGEGRHGEKPAAVNLRPLDDRVVVEAQDAAEKTAGGILLPDTAKQKPQQGG